MPVTGIGAGRSEVPLAKDFEAAPPSAIIPGNIFAVALLAS
jgi:hypothetical protein